MNTIALDADVALRNEQVRPVVRAVAAVLFVWNAAGWLLAFNAWGQMFASVEGFKACLSPLLMVALTGVFLALELHIGPQLVLLRKKNLRDAFNIWILAGFMACGWSLYSAHHSLFVVAGVHIPLEFSGAMVMAVIANAPALASLSIAAFTVPALPWAIESGELAPWPTAPGAPAKGDRGKSWVANLQGAVKGAAAGAAVAAVMANPASAEPATSTTSHVQKASASRASASRSKAKKVVAQAGDRVEAERLLRLGYGTRRVEKLTGVARSTAQKLRERIILAEGAGAIAILNEAALVPA